MMFAPRPRLQSACIAAVLALAAYSGGAGAQNYPDRTVRIIAGTSPGGTLDLLSRLSAQKLTDLLGRAFIVENRPGAAGTIAAEQVAKSPSDGYVLMMGSASILGISPALYPKLGYDPIKDFAPVGMAANASFMLVANPSVPVKSVKELIALAKSKPGQLNYGSSGNGSFTHLAMELLKSMAGLDIQHVPYTGTGGAAQADLLSGKTQLMMSSVATQLPFVKAGKLRGLAVTGSRRTAIMPDLSTMAEAGVTGYDADSWFGIVAPAGTPRNIVTILNTAMIKGLNNAETRGKLLAQGLEPVDYTPDQFAQLIRDEVPKWAKVVKLSGATASD